MSVIHFDAAELANVAAYLCTSRYSGAERLRQTLEDLAAYSVGNTWAYNRNYNASAEPVSYVDLVNACSPRFDRERARGTLRLLQYNGVTNAGSETVLPSYHAAVARLMGDAFGRLMDELDDAKRPPLDPAWTR